MKKFALVILLTLMLEMVCLHVLAEDQRIDAEPGEKIEAELVLMENPDKAIGADIILEYDHSVFELLPIGKIISDKSALMDYNGLPLGLTIKPVFRVKQNAAFGQYTISIRVSLAINIQETEITSMVFSSCIVNVYETITEPGQELYENGAAFFLEGDYEMAVAYYRVAANQGNSNAQYNLGLCYESGWGVAQDINEALKYYSLAADQGDSRAKEKVEALTSSLENVTGAYKDGEYEGTGNGIMGKITVKVTIKDGKIANVEILSHSETEVLGGVALPQYAQQTVEKNGLDIDGVGGATVSLKGYKEAVNDALSKAKGEALTPTTENGIGAYRDGKYEGTGEGFGGKIVVKVIIKDGRIADVVVLDSSNEVPAIGGAAMPELVKMTVEMQGVDFDGVSGATVSSEGFKEAVADALSKAH